MDDFLYQPLDQQKPSFRLLRLRKGGTPKIECDIFQESIAGHPSVEYEALSYAWGSTDLVDCIEVHGQELWVTENVFSALWHLRYPDRDRILWVDAICIDQANDLEKSQQVQEMGKIYCSARRVIIWLGRPTPDVTLLMNSLSELFTQQDMISIFEAEVRKKAWSSIQLRLEARHKDLLHRQREGLESLLRRPWFERIWIIQEVANARSAVIQTGTLSIPADIFTLSPILLELNVKPHIQSILDIMPGPDRNDVRRISEQDHLIDLLKKFRASKATDTRDKIFALHSLSCEPSEHKFLRPDYTKSLSEVVHNTLRYWFESTSVTIGQVIDFLVNFETIQVIYLVPLRRTQTARETIQIPLRSDRNTVLKCIRSASLFLLEEQERKKTFYVQDTPQTELDRLRVKLDDDITYDDALRVVSWHGSKQNLHFLVIENAKEALLMAASSGCKQIFDLIADGGTDDKEELLRSALCHAIEQKNWNVVELLLDKGADANTQLEQGISVLQAVSRIGHVQITKMLLAKGADVNARAGYYGGSSALIIACENGHEKIVHLLLEKGADTNARPGYFDSALVTACENGHERIVHFLLEKGADINTRAGYYGSVLAIACEKGHENVVQLLLERGADVNARPGHHKNVLLTACEKGHEKVVQQLLNGGADVNVRAGYHGSVLLTACEKGHEKVVRLLLENGANMNARSGYHDSALLIACENGHEKVVQLLLDKGTDIDTQRREHVQILQKASAAGWTHVVQNLIGRYPDTGAER